MRRWLIAVLLAATVAFAPGTASAGPNDDMGTNPFVNQIGPTTVNVGLERTDLTVTVTRAGANGVVACTYEILSGLAARQRLLVVYGIDVGDVDPANRYVFRICNDGTQPVTLVATFRIGEPITQVVIDALVVSAYDHLEIPVVAQQGAPRGDTFAPLVVRLPTWLWVDPASWIAVSQDAAIPGARVVATATPTQTTWNPGTGDAPILCAGGGAAYDFTRPDAAQSSACSYTYRDSSALQPDTAFTMQLTVRWEVTWVCEPACGSGTLPPFQITSARPVRVAEVQALNTRSQ